MWLFIHLFIIYLFIPYLFIYYSSVIYSFIYLLYAEQWHEGGVLYTSTDFGRIMA